MKQYIDLVRQIALYGKDKKDRTGTGTKSIFGHQMRFKMSDGFPLLTIKKTHFKSIATELIWFLKGDTNIQWLEQNGCSIWRDWPYKKYLQEPLANVTNLNSSLIYNKEWVVHTGLSFMSPTPHRHFTSEEFAERIKSDDEFAKKFGTLGPVYGKQWVDWGGHAYMFEVGAEYSGGSFGGATIKHGGVLKEFYAKGINQIQIAIDRLKTNPEDRGIIVSAWNVNELKDMALRPCHAFFQFYTTELTYAQRIKWFITNYYETGMEYKILLDTMKNENLDKVKFYDEEIAIPKYNLSLQLYQRSVDTFLGCPFNIASYSLLLHMIAQCVNMVPEDFVWTGGDVHLYSNHTDQTIELLKRWDELPVDEDRMTVFPKLPTLKLNPEIKNIFDFKMEDITVEGYNPMPSIKAPVAV
jgi:thymidylate synthase